MTAEWSQAAEGEDLELWAAQDPYNPKGLLILSFRVISKDNVRVMLRRYGSEEECSRHELTCSSRAEGEAERRRIVDHLDEILMEMDL